MATPSFWIEAEKRLLAFHCFGLSEKNAILRRFSTFGVPSLFNAHIADRGNQPACWRVEKP